MKKIDWIKTSKHILIASAGVLIVMLLFSMLESLLVVKEILSIETVLHLQKLFLTIATFIACLLSAHRAGHGKMIVSLIGFAVIVGMLLLMKLVFCARFEMRMGPSVLFMFIAAIIAGLVSGRKRARY